jgi:phosphoesterase RecJ-like protein
MRQKGIASEVLLFSELPRRYAFIFLENAVEYRDVEKGWPEGFGLEGFDALLVVDTGTWSQLPGLEQRIERWGGTKIVVDHHLTQETWADVKLVATEAAAAGEIVAELLHAWGIKIDRAIAEALYLAVASDTGWFQFSNTRPYTLRLAASLMESGVNTDRMYQALYQNERVERVRLQTRAMESMELSANGRLAVMRISKQDFEQTGAHAADTENLINVPLQIATVEVSMLLCQPMDQGPIRVSLRSKGQVDVAKFAQRFGGGGHARAAGLALTGTLEQARDRVVAAMMQEMG